MRKKGRYFKSTRDSWERSRLLRGSLLLELVACSCWYRGPDSSSSRQLSEDKTPGASPWLFWAVWEEKGVPSATVPQLLWPLQVPPAPAQFLPTSEARGVFQKHKPEHGSPL